MHFIFLKNNSSSHLVNVDSSLKRPPFLHSAFIKNVRGGAGLLFIHQSRLLFTSLSSVPLPFVRSIFHMIITAGSNFSIKSF